MMGEVEAIQVLMNHSRRRKTWCFKSMKEANGLIYAAERLWGKYVIGRERWKTMIVSKLIIPKSESDVITNTNSPLLPIKSIVTNKWLKKIIHRFLLLIVIWTVSLSNAPWQQKGSIVLNKMSVQVYIFLSKYFIICISNKFIISFSYLRFHLFTFTVYLYFNV